MKPAEGSLPPSVVEAGDAEVEKLGEVGGCSTSQVSSARQILVHQGELRDRSQMVFTVFSLHAHSFGACNCDFICRRREPIWCFNHFNYLLISMLLTGNCMIINKSTRKEQTCIRTGHSHPWVIYR